MTSEVGQPVLSVAIMQAEQLPGKGRIFFFPSIEMVFKYNLLFLPGERASLPMNPRDAEMSAISFQKAMFPN